MADGLISEDHDAKLRALDKESEASELMNAIKELGHFQRHHRDGGEDALIQKLHQCQRQRC